MDLLRTKSIEQSLADADEPGYRLKKSLSALDLTVFGIGVIIGAGIFTLTGRAAHNLAGPAVVLSFVLAAVGCGLAALCYAEFSAAVPVAGSAYTFSYAALGEIFAWIIGWDLILEFFMAAATVAQGWSAYFGTFLDQLTGQPSGSHVIPDAIAYGANGADVGFNVDLMAMLLVLLLGTLMVLGIKESMRVNLALVSLKLFIVVFVIVAGIGFIDRANWTPFVPASSAPPADVPQAGSTLAQPLLQWLLGLEPSSYGVMGIFSGAALVFFAYLGFDIVATTAEEAKNPRRDLPIGIIASLVVCTVLYCAVALVVTGMVSYEDITQSAALANAFAYHGQTWMAVIISAGAVAGLTTVVLTTLTGATRMVFAMGRDNLLPLRLATVHPRFRTPYVAGSLVTLACALVTGLTPVGVLEEMVNIGTLSAFVLVSIAVWVLRHKRPDLPRPFRVAGLPVIASLAVVVCAYLMLNLAIETWLRFLVWLAVGFALYFLYSVRHARVGTGKKLS
ncbi:MAG: amino acid permease [Propionibacteriaceae bacterium]|jgi:APA family basic amino acid/polyamine antiporter|nr:amino acid permease [Propionibacteriaceae bacterium]